VGVHPRSLSSEDGEPVALIEKLDDRTLVEQHRAGDDDAFRQIVLRHHRALYANALRRLGDPVLAEDAVQEAFLRAFRNLDRFEGEYHLDAWLHRIVTNTCHDIGRRRGRDTRLFDRACTAVDVDAPAADDELTDALGTGEVDVALGQLPESYREVLFLRFVDELSYADLAERAGISEENARARVSRGRSMLKRLMSSTSALVLWAIPPLRKAQLQVSDPDAAAQAAQRVHDLSGVAGVVSTTTSSGGFGSLTSLVVQAGPTIASVTPAATSSAPALKAAAAAAIAAAVVIPTGVAVDRVIDDPQRNTAAPLLEEDASAGAPSVDVADGAPQVADPTTPPSASGDAPIQAVAATPAVVEDAVIQPPSAGPTASEPAAPAPGPAGEGPAAPPAPETPPTSEPEPPAPAPEPARAELRADGLTVTDSGRSLDIAGPVRIAVGDEEIVATVTGKIGFAEADPKNASAPREVYLSNLRLDLGDGRTLDLKVSGTVTVDSQGQNARYGFDLAFGLAGGADLGLPESGDLGGTLERRGGSGSLVATLVERTA